MKLSMMVLITIICFNIEKKPVSNIRFEYDATYKFAVRDDLGAQVGRKYKGLLVSMSWIWWLVSSDTVNTNQQ